MTVLADLAVGVIGGAITALVPMSLGYTTGDVEFWWIAVPMASVITWLYLKHT